MALPGYPMIGISRARRNTQRARRETKVMEHYKGYKIEELQTSPGRWRSRVQRLDGQKIKILSDGKEVESITTGGMESFSPADAIALAKQMIDGGGMQ